MPLFLLLTAFSKHINQKRGFPQTSTYQPVRHHHYDTTTTTNYYKVFVVVFVFEIVRALTHISACRSSEHQPRLQICSPPTSAQWVSKEIRIHRAGVDESKVTQKVMQGPTSLAS